MSGGVKNISVSDCQFMGTDVGLRFKSARGRGGVVENIFIHNINMFNIVNEPLLFDLYYFTQKTDDIPAVDETTPVFKDIYIRDIVSRNSNKALFFFFFPEMNVTNINVENAFITSRFGAEISESENIKLKNVTVIPSEGAALILNNIKNAVFDDFFAPDSLEPVVKITGTRNRNIRLPENMNKL
jgi:polygalacturonase